jgi:hypothetical protein
MHVGRRTDYRERNSFGIDHNMALRAGGRRTELPLSVGLGPVHSPPFWPRHLPSLQQHATILSCPHLRAYPRAPGATSPTHLLVASLEVYASR